MGSTTGFVLLRFSNLERCFEFRRVARGERAVAAAAVFPLASAGGV